MNMIADLKEIEALLPMMSVIDPAELIDAEFAQDDDEPPGFSVDSFLGDEGKVAREIGQDALRRANGKDGFITSPEQIVGAMLKAMRDPVTCDHQAEIIVAAFNAWARVEDLSITAMESFQTIVEAALSGIDQECCC